MDETSAKAIVLGEQCREFLGSPVGRYIVGAAEHEANEAMRAFAEANAADEAQIRQLQQPVYLYCTIQRWIDEAITAGVSAEQEHADL